MTFQCTLFTHTHTKDNILYTQNQDLSMQTNDWLLSVPVVQIHHQGIQQVAFGRNSYKHYGVRVNFRKRCMPSIHRRRIKSYLAAWCASPLAFDVGKKNPALIGAHSQENVSTASEVFKMMLLRQAECGENVFCFFLDQMAMTGQISRPDFGQS